VRGCIIAPEGKKLCIADLSNIEGRVLVWLAGESWKLKAFKQYDLGDGPDMYIAAYARAFNMDPAKVTKKDRQKGKVMELACLAGDTPVVTSNGVKVIKEVLLTDLLWDGESWVQHNGLVERGVKPTVNVDGISLTPDHLTLVGKTWIPALTLASNENTLCQALATASVNLPSYAALESDAARATWMSLRSSAPVGQRHTRCSTTTCEKDAAPGATCAPKSSQRTGAKTSGSTPTWWQTMRTAVGFFTESLRVSTVATTRTTAATPTTVAGAFASTNLGEQTAVLFSRTWSRLKAGMRRALSWIGKMSTGATNPGIYASSRSEQTTPTAEKSGICSAELTISKPVYDLLNAGQLNRFTVVTKSGNLIVHNCGYEGGVGAFLTFAAVYQMDLDDLAKAVWSSASHDAIEHATGMWNWTVKKKRSTFGLTKEVWIACEILKALWREAHPAVVELWADAASAMRSAFRTPGTAYHVGKRIKVQRDGTWTRVRLPSGRVLCYLDVQVDDSGQISYQGINQYTRQWGWWRTGPRLWPVT